MERRLAAILAADIVGYTRLMGVDEAGTLTRLKALREELILAVPDYGVCDQKCRGLCPVCGANFNKSLCNCGNDESDPRWDALEVLRSGQSDERK